MSKMVGEETVLNSDARTGKMIFQPILEEGVFRFDCSADDRNGAFPSISFENPKVRDTPLANVHNVPTYIPNFECVLGQQMAKLEVTQYIVTLLAMYISLFIFPLRKIAFCIKF